VVEKLVTYLEMRTPGQLRPARAVDGLRVVQLEDPDGADAARIGALHDAIATPHLWSSLQWSGDRRQRPLADSRRSHWVASVDGVDMGWASLLVEDDGSVEIASFGVRPEAVGRGYGGAFLSELVRQAWRVVGDRDDVAGDSRRIWLHTSSWDHPNAVANYFARGFRVTRRELQQQQAGSDERPARPVEQPPEVLVRPAVPQDAPAVTTLLSDLGYPRPVEVVEERLRRLSSSPDGLAAAAVVGGEHLAGVLTGHLVPLLAEAEPALLRMTALSVAPDQTRRGLGRRLVEFAEYFAQLHGCLLVEVSSGRRAERDAAHRFYPALGFEDSGETSIRYWKRLT
jgi:GNAT superfamily N-acetyltransferase